MLRLLATTAVAVSFSSQTGSADPSEPSPPAGRSSPPGAAGFSFGSWWARLPLKASADGLMSSDGDLNGTLAALRATNQTLVGFSAEVCGTSTTKGDCGTGGVGIGDLVDFLDAAAESYPELRVFATYSSHHPLSEYCTGYLNDGKTDVNWTRVGTMLAAHTGENTSNPQQNLILWGCL